MLLTAGARFAGHIVEHALGRGGSSEVYLVEDADGTQWTLKFLVGDALRSPRARARFQREYDIARPLVHPNVVRMHQHGVQADRPWLTMQYVDGHAATVLVPGPRAQPDLHLVLEVLGCIADALDYVHGAGVVHRDVKPSNILVAERDPGKSVLTDFGIARRLDDDRPLARGGRVLGSIPYVAPEVLQAQQVLPASDQYSLAATMVELLTGAPPYPLANQFAIANAHRSAAPPRLSARRRWIPLRVDAIVAKGLAKNPNDRYPDCAELVRLVARALVDVQPESARGPLRRHLYRLRP